MRRSLWILLGGCLLGVACGGEGETSGAGSAGAGTANRHKDWARDERLEALVVDCYEKGHFNADTSDMLPVLIGKLQTATLDVLRNVREELARSGEPAIVELERLVRRSYSDVHASATIVNALGVIQLSDAGSSPTAQKLLRDCLGHPQETIRNATIRVLTRHAQPSHYDDLMTVLSFTHDTTQSDVITALYTADPKRLEADFQGWLERDEMRGLQLSAARLIAQGADAETAERLLPMIMIVENRVVRAFLVSLVDNAAGYSGGGYEILEAMLADEEPQIRSDALAALEYTDATHLIAPVLRNDPQSVVRMMACSLLGHRLDEEVALEAVQFALNDEDEQVREAALGFLLSIGDARAVDTALSLLSGGRGQIGNATRALGGKWDANPGLDARVLALLQERFKNRSKPALADNRYLLQAIAQVPGPESTEWLLEQISEFSDDQSLGDGSGWIIMQASNTGELGLELLRDLWRTETDLERRFDLMWAASFEHDDATREFLFEVLEAERSAPHERLYAAERLAREGPASLVAPRIKRAGLRMSDPVFRPAIECLLWRWYG